MKKGILIMLAVCMLFLSACGSTASENDEATGYDGVKVVVRDLDSDEEEAEVDFALASVTDLNGIWVSQTQSDGTSYIAVINHSTDSGIITVYKVDVYGFQDLYWYGTVTPQSTDYNSVFSWESTRAGYDDMISDEASIVFHYQHGFLRFQRPGLTEDSDTITVWFTRISHNGVADESLGSAVEPEPIEEIEIITDKDTDENTTKNDIILETEETDNAAEPSTSQCNHIYGQPVVIKQPTCTQTGSQQESCQICGYTITTEIPENGHNYTATVTKEATCNSTGTWSYVCIDCGDTYEQTIPKTEHDWQPVYKDEDGHWETVTLSDPVYETMYTCSECGDTFKTSAEAREHVVDEHGTGSWVQQEVMVEDAVTDKVWVIDSEGNEVDYYVCSICGNTKES